MDGLSGAASVIGVVSLAVQLAQGISHLRSFFESVSNAPKDIVSVINDLALLARVLEQIQTDEDASIAVLETCMEKVVHLHKLIDELEPGFRSSKSYIKKYTAYKWARMDSTLGKLRETLEGTKSTLIVALLMAQSDSRELLRYHPSWPAPLIMLPENTCLLTC